MDHATLRTVFAFGIYCYLLITSEPKSPKESLDTAPDLARRSVTYTDLLFKALSDGDPEDPQ